MVRWAKGHEERITDHKCEEYLLDGACNCTNIWNELTPTPLPTMTLTEDSVSASICICSCGYKLIELSNTFVGQGCRVFCRGCNLVWLKQFDGRWTVRRMVKK